MENNFENTAANTDVVNDANNGASEYGNYRQDAEPRYARKRYSGRSELPAEDIKLIYNPSVARSLIRDYDHKVLDIRRDRSDPDGKRSVFVFEKTVKFLEDFGRIARRNSRYNRGNATENTFVREVPEN